MTKAELVAEISTKTGIEKTVALQAVEAAMKVIKNTMADERMFTYAGLVHLSLKKELKN
jgi:DNA-binding protein HU-beta